MRAVAVIPARHASTRLPGKPLRDICGKPLIQRVWEIVSRTQGLDDVVVPTDDGRIANVVERFGGRAYMTSPECRSGADRVCEVADALIRASVEARLRNIRLVITDVDGMLTDGRQYYGPDDECLKRFHARDGLAVRLLQQAEIQVAVFSGRDCPALRRRLVNLGITEAVPGQVDMRAALSGIMERCGVVAEEVVFIGDDIPDMEVFGLCGVSVTVGDAPDYVKARADLVLKCMGGFGAFREMVDRILEKKAGSSVLPEKEAS